MKFKSDLENRRKMRPNISYTKCTYNGLAINSILNKTLCYLNHQEACYNHFHIVKNKPTFSS